MHDKTQVQDQISFVLNGKPVVPQPEVKEEVETQESDAPQEDSE